MAEHEYYEVNGRQIRVRPTESGQEIDEYGNFHRQPNHFTKGFGEGENPVEADRYILFWGKGCNWSNRASIARELLGLDKAIKVEIVDWGDYEKPLGWEFVNSPDHINKETGAQFLSELYYNADDDYEGRTTVPALVDYKEKKVVNNDYHHLTNHFETAFKPLDGYDLQIEVTDIPSVFSGVTSGTYQIGVNNFSYNEERAKSYLYSYPYDKIGYVFITKKGAPEVKTFADAAGKSFEGQSGVSVTTAIESWNEKNPDKKIDITYTDADTAITLQHIEDGTTDLAIIDVAMYNAYQKEYNYDVVANQISDEDAKAIADNSYAYYIFPKDQEELRDKVDEQLKELKKDGTLSKLSQKYFGQDTAPEDDQFEKTPN